MKSSKEFSQIMLYLHPTDMRKQMLGLASIVEDILEKSPFDGSLFIFCNRRRDIIKALYFDRAGFCLWSKKLDQSKFPWLKSKDKKSIVIPAEDLDLILNGVDVFKRHEELNFTSLD